MTDVPDETDPQTGTRPGPERPPAPTADAAPEVALGLAAARRAGEGAVLAAVSVGGAIGACARYALSLAWPAPPTGLPWATLLINLLGCAAIGVLMACVAEDRLARPAHPLLRPFLGVGVLGGFTTFSTYAVDVVRLLRADAPGAAAACALGTLLGAVLAVWAAASATRAVLDRAGKGAA
ncbi:fluoride efflux transporter CrcB [Streptomyces sp. BI20]|uniref:fluoride efflux transporter CrcB n=1 Tax=Streptomyces sp. BI20 TaxID=3403460 RepID=UPI003C727989